MKALFLIGCLALVGCTDAGFGRLTSLGSSATIVCSSGGVTIFEGKSTGKVISEENSDGYYFRDASNGKMTEVSGACVIVYID